MRTKTFEFTIPEILLSALINGDISGLDDTEIQAVEDLDQQAADLAEQEKSTHYCWDIPEDQEPFFTPYHNALGIKTSNCLDIECVVFIDETRVKS